MLIKYCTAEYPTEVHDALQRLGLTPQLRGCRTLPGGLVQVRQLASEAERTAPLPLEYFCSLVLRACAQVVSDLFSQEDGWVCMASLPVTGQKEALSAVVAAIQRVHDMGAVLGDCRTTNVMLRRKPGATTWKDVEVHLVDLDCEYHKGLNIMSATRAA